MTKNGKVYLIGAGPGDPGLLSIKAMECLQIADTVVYDRLADPRILSYAKKDAEMIYVGKASSQHTMRQPDINNLLVKLAAEGKIVARLKGGDPLVFGRGGEEAIALSHFTGVGGEPHLQVGLRRTSDRTESHGGELFLQGQQQRSLGQGLAHVLL